MKVGIASTLVAIVGVVLPFLFGYLFFIGIGASQIVALFIGATMTATSVGVTMRIFSENQILQF